MIRRFLRRIVAHVERARPERIIDLGCGEGVLAKELDRLSFQVDYLGVELNPEALDAARTLNPTRSFRQADILQLPAQPGWADVALCLEVLEHLPQPEPAVRKIAEWTRRSAIVSVPWEPFFRIGNFLRGKYLARLGNHPEHVQQFTPRSFERLLRQGFAEVEVETCFPWLIARCSAPRR